MARGEHIGKGGYVQTPCDRGIHDDRLYDYNPARVICLNCARIAKLSTLGPRKILKVKRIEHGHIKDFEALDYEDGPNGWPVERKVQS